MTTTLSTEEIDAAAAEEFAGRLIGVFNDGFVALMTSIGHQSGLFDAMAALPAASSQQIADAAGLNERYVREWLGAMTTARIVRHDSATGTYLLPREHAGSLTRAAGPDNIARLMPYVALLAQVEQPILDCFRNGGGLPYSAYPRFHQVMAEDSAGAFDAGLVDVVLPVVPGLPAHLRSGIDVADIGCGEGHAINLMARAFPASCFTGYDFSEQAIAQARAEAVTLGLSNATFEVLDVAQLHASSTHDLITAFDAIHDQADPAGVLQRAHDALRPGGVFLMVDIKASSNVDDNIELPWGSSLYAMSTLHCMAVSLGDGGAGLGTAWGAQLAVAMLAEAGFVDVHVEQLDADPFNNFYVARRG